MFGVRHFIAILIIGCLTLFSNFAMAGWGDERYGSAAAASAACDAYLDYIDPNGTIGYVCTEYNYGTFGHFKQNSVYFNWQTGCYPGTYADSNDLCVTNPTDQECQAKTGQEFTIPVSVDENVGHMTSTVSDGCLFNLNFYSPSGEGVGCSVSDNFGVMICNAIGVGVSASTSSATSGIGTAAQDLLDVTQGGNASADEVIDFPHIETDSPGVGDTTTTQTKTNTTSYSPQENITNKSESVTHDAVTGGNKTKTETVETIQYSDGSTAVKTTTTTTVDDTTTISTTIDFEDGTYSQSTSTYNGSSSTRTKTDTTNADGSTSSTTENTGDSPDNGRNEDEVSGTCLDDGNCNTEIDSSIATDKLDTLFDSAIATVTGDNVSESDFLPNFIELPSGTCANPSFSHSSSLASFNKSIDICTKTEDLRNGLGWLFYMMTIFAIYHIATRS